MLQASRLWVWLAVLSAAMCLEAQELKWLTPQEYAQLAGEISGDASYEHIRHNTQFHRPRGGAEGLMEVARYYEQKAREFGLSDVKLIRQKATTGAPLLSGPKLGKA
jgi:hypothetical protein